MRQLCLVRDVPSQREVTPGDMVQTAKGRFLVCTVDPTEEGVTYICVNKTTGSDARVSEKDIIFHDPATAEGRIAFAQVLRVTDRLVGLGDFSV